MANYTIQEEVSISQSEVYDLINKKSKLRDLTYREEKVVEHVKKICSKPKSVKIIKDTISKLKELEISRLEDDLLIKIVDSLPKNGTELRAVVQNTGVIFKEEDVSNILKILENIGK